jgi:tricarballylate dehydrogenase
VRPGTFNPEGLDDCATSGLTPEKSHWARALDTPPFRVYPMRPAVICTYLGVGVNARAQILMADGRPARNMFAAGAIMAVNVLREGYLGGIGMTIGSVFGRAAGQGAGTHVAR